MNILVTLNSGYVLPLCTMLKSLSYSNEGTDIDLYIVHSSLTLADFQKINAVTINTDISLHPIKVDNSLLTVRRRAKEFLRKLITGFSQASFCQRSLTEFYISTPIRL